MALVTVTKPAFLALLESGAIEWPPVWDGTNLYGFSRTMDTTGKWTVYRA